MSPAARGVASLAASLLLSLFLSARPARTDESKRLVEYPYNSCVIRGDTQWTGAADETEIKSWIASATPLFSNNAGKKKRELPDLDGMFYYHGDAYWVDVVRRRNETGPAWFAYGDKVADGWLYHPSLEAGDAVGNSVWNVSAGLAYYVYPDLETALEGKVVGGRLTEARTTRVISHRCFGGILELMFGPADSGSASYKYKPLGKVFPAEEQTIMDPYDRRNIYIGPSGLTALRNGDGLFARRDLPPHRLVVTYAGNLIVEEEIFSSNMTDEEQFEAHKNLLHYDDVLTLDVPPEFTPIEVYRASLGHKANHSFRPNVNFCFFTSPRFGDIRGLMSNRRIRKGEEIFVNYSYDMKSELVPDWYVEQKKLWQLQQKMAKAKKNAKEIKATK